MISEKLKEIPKSSGCYLFKDDKQQIIYVGMSKYLPKRVSSYFQKNHVDKKTIALVETIRDVEFMTTTTTEEALLLEEELIKTYKPKYNIKCKDDKKRNTFLFFTDESFPKLSMSRTKPENKKFLEFTSSQLCYEVNNLLHDIFNLRSCSYNLSSENVSSGKFKSCLEYHLGRCNAPCMGLQTGLDYLRDVYCIREIFDFNFSRAKTTLSGRMYDLSKLMQFEKAADIHHRISLLTDLEKRMEPIRVRDYSKVAQQIKLELGLRNLPLMIEAFDNSHHQGECNVAASVRFVNQKPDKNQYRKYNIKSFSGANDYASFDEVLNRRFKRLVEEKQQLPHLVIIDGGVGQLNVAKRVFDALELTNKVDLISISKNDRHKSSVIHLTNGKTISIMDNLNYSVLAQVQDEVHRFAVKFHREKKSKKLLT